MKRRPLPQDISSHNIENVDSDIRDIILDINRFTKTYFSCEGHVSDRLLVRNKGAYKTHIKNEAYVVFDSHECVEQVFKGAGFDVSINVPNESDREILRNAGYDPAIFDRIVARIDLHEFPRSNVYSADQVRKIFGKAWDDVRKGLKKC